MDNRQGHRVAYDGDDAGDLPATSAQQVLSACRGTSKFMVASFAAVFISMKSRHSRAEERRVVSRKGGEEKSRGDDDVSISSRVVSSYCFIVRERSVGCAHRIS